MVTRRVGTPLSGSGLGVEVSEEAVDPLMAQMRRKGETGTPQTGCDRATFRQTSLSEAVEGASFRKLSLSRTLLAHPHVAELYDAGVTPSGQPYLVLEYVEGQHIDIYCDERELDVEMRLFLFLDVLLSVAHAHANLVVHRETREVAVYELLLARPDGKLGPGLRHVDCAQRPQALCNSSMTNNTVLHADAISLDLLAQKLSSISARVVIQKTGLEGAFDVSAKSGRRPDVVLFPGSHLQN